MIVPDVNLLLYAVIDGYPQHEAARRWWVGALNGDEPIGLVPVVLTGFVRLATNRQVLADPFDVGAAAGLTRQWMRHRTARVLTTSAAEVDAALNLLDQIGTAGNLTTDALIAAHARIVRGTVYSNDGDFGRFPDVKWVNPLRS